MTKRQAVRECKRMWLGKGGIKESGLSKDYFLNSPAGGEWLDKHHQNDCPLCEYDGAMGNCSRCPLWTQYGETCSLLGFDDNPPAPRFFEAVRGLRE